MIVVYRVRDTSKAVLWLVIVVGVLVAGWMI
jgi:hypothetical protein